MKYLTPQIVRLEDFCVVIKVSSFEGIFDKTTFETKYFCVLIYWKIYLKNHKSRIVQFPVQFSVNVIFYVLILVNFKYYQRKWDKIFFFFN